MAADIDADWCLFDLLHVWLEMNGLNVVYWLFQLFERFYPVFLTHWSIVLNSMPPVLVFGLCLPVYYLPPGAPFSVFSQLDIRAIISAPYLFGVVTFVLFAVATPNKYGDLLFESRVTSRRLRESEAQLDYRPGSEIGVGWKIGVTWSRKRSFKTAATELG